jgi:ABC-type sulfate/molybdate transport systems ATPase subunit
MSGSPVLVVRALRKSYRAGVDGCLANARALADVHLDVYRGEVIALGGSCAAGKTTLLRCIAGLLAADDGVIEHAHDERGRTAAVCYFGSVVEASRAARIGVGWDLALVDDIDRVTKDVAAAFALVRLVALARAAHTTLLLAAREPRLLRDVADRTVVLDRGRIAGSSSEIPRAVARVAEHAAPLTVIPSAPSIR